MQLQSVGGLRRLLALCYFQRISVLGSGRAGRLAAHQTSWLLLRLMPCLFHPFCCFRPPSIADCNPRLEPLRIHLGFVPQWLRHWSSPQLYPGARPPLDSSYDTSDRDSTECYVQKLSGSFWFVYLRGIFLRTLQEALRQGFKHEPLKEKASLIRRLIGSPRLVQQLQGLEHDVAVEGYIIAFRTLFLAGAALAMLTLLFQAGTGWTAPESKDQKNDEYQRDALSPVISRESVVG